MREVFRSLRLETVEGAAELLRQHAIEVTVLNGRSYSGGRRRRFSFRDTPDAAATPQLWVVHNGDLPRARELLRDTGLIEPSQRESFLNADQRPETIGPKKSFWSPQKLRTALLVLILLSVMFVFGTQLLV